MANLIFFIIFFFSLTLKAELISTKNPKALCSNGEQANFSYFENESNDWFVYFWGGGVAPTEKHYKERPDGMKSPAASSDEGKHHIIDDFINNNFNVIVVHYCSNDIYQGKHINKVDGKNVYFHGRYIVEDLFDQFDPQFNSANKLVFSGHSAGALSLGFNADLIAKYDNPLIIPDSFWLDSESLAVRLSWTDGFWDTVESFLYNNRYDYCKDGHWANCFPTRSRFDEFNLKNVFFIWNIGDPYIKGDMNKVRQSIKNDADYYQAGFSVNAEKMKLKAFEDWGHVMTANELYYQKFDGNSLQDLIWNWINGSGSTVYIKND